MGFTDEKQHLLSIQSSFVMEQRSGLFADRVMELTSVLMLFA